MDKKEIIDDITKQVIEEKQLNQPICIDGVDFDYVDKIGGMPFLYSYDHDIEVDVDENLTVGQLTCILEGLS